MWIEPDCNAPSGESFIRQVLHGTGWWEKAFGEHGGQRHLYLPDTFGFPASMPQIVRDCGLDTFITNKISWCERNRFPHVSFEWIGIDGSSVLTHLTPGHNYNSSILPADLTFAQKNVAELDHALNGTTKNTKVVQLSGLGPSLDPRRPAASPATPRLPDLPDLQRLGGSERILRTLSCSSSYILVAYFFTYC